MSSGTVPYASPDVSEAEARRSGPDEIINHAPLLEAPSVVMTEVFPYSFVLLLESSEASRPSTQRPHAKASCDHS